MTLAVTATDSELPKPINAMFIQKFLRNARARCPYFTGTNQAELIKHGGTATAKWRSIANLTPTTSALSEVTTAAYMQAQTPSNPSATDTLATVSKYGQFIILNEEADLFNYNGQTAKLMEVLSISAGRSLNQLQRNVAEDNLTAIYANGASDGAVNTISAVNDFRLAINVLSRNSAMTFTPMTMGDQRVGTTPTLPAFWAIMHDDVAQDVSQMTGFKSVETYAGQVDTVMGEFGLISSAGMSTRCIASEDASVTTNTGATGGTAVRETTASKADLYDIVIYGQDCLGSVGFGTEQTDGIYRAGDPQGVVELIVKGFGSGGTSDPYNEIKTMAWKAWHAGALLDANWGRRIRCAATDLTA